MKAIVCMILNFFSILVFAGQYQVKEMVPGEFIIKVKSHLNIKNWLESQSDLSGNVFQKIKVRTQFPMFNLVHIQVPELENSDLFLQKLMTHKDVEFVEPNFIFRPLDLTNDPDLVKQWGLQNWGQKDYVGRIGKSGVDVGVTKAWNLERGSKDIFIALTDSGVRCEDPDIVDNLWVNLPEKNGKSGVDDDNNGYVDDIHGYDFVNNDGVPDDELGHGSHCAGIIGAKGNNGIGISGVNWETSIMALKFIGKNGQGLLSDALRAVEYAIKMKARVINASWGGKNKTRSLELAIEEAGNVGILFIAAAGNEDHDNDLVPIFPANAPYENIISVGAIANTGALSIYSNFSVNKVHLVAPGDGIWSLDLNGYGYKDGTSMAAPFVTGVAALVLSHFPNMSMLKLKNRLLQTSIPVRGAYKKTKFGLVSAYNAIVDEIPAYADYDPRGWPFSQPWRLETVHPVKSGFSQEWVIEQPKAKKLSLYFDKIELDNDRDYIAIEDANSNIVEMISGKWENYFSEEVTGGYLKIRIHVAGKKHLFGFSASKIVWTE